MTELKPCPFCGSEPRIWHDIFGEPSGVQCKCGALVRFIHMPEVKGKNFGVVQKRITERWNRRAGG